MWTLSFIGTKKNKMFVKYEDIHQYLFNFCNVRCWDRETLSIRISIYHDNTLYEMDLEEFFHDRKNPIEEKYRFWWKHPEEVGK